MAELVYELSFQGAASELLAGAFEECEVSTARGVTTLRTGPVDQAALQGLIARIFGLALVLIDVRLVAEAGTGSEWAREP